jgi:hypothetical protein
MSTNLQVQMAGQFRSIHLQVTKRLREFKGKKPEAWLEFSQRVYCIAYPALQTIQREFSLDLDRGID